MIFLKNFVFEKASKLYLHRGIIALLLVEVLRKKKEGCEIPLLYLFREVNLIPGNTCFGCFFSESVD